MIKIVIKFLVLKLLKTCCILLFIAIGTLAYGQYRLANFKQYSIADGLANNKILSIAQDDHGYMWIGTISGLNRFDGGHFEHIDELLPAEKHNTAYPLIHNFGNNLLGIGTEEGAYMLNTTSLNLRHIKLPCSKELNYYKNNVQGLALTNKGHLALSTKTGFYVVDNKDKVIFENNHYTDADIGKTWILYGHKLAKDDKGQLIQMADDGTNRYDADKNSFTHDPSFPFLPNNDRATSGTLFFNTPQFLFTLSFKNKMLYAYHLVTKEKYTIALSKAQLGNLFWNTSIVKKSDSEYLINGKSGIYHLSFDSVQNKMALSELPDMPEVNAYTIFIDSEGMLWLGTNNGLYKEEIPHSIQSYAFGLTTKTNHTDICKHSSSIVAALDNGYIIEYDAKTKQQIKKINVSKLGLAKINSVENSTDNNYFVGTDKGLYQLNLTTESIKKVVLNKCNKDFDNDLYITRIIKDKSGNIVLMTADANLQLIYNRNTDCFDWVLKDYKHKRPNISVAFGLSDDKDQNYWFYGDGIYKYNKKKNTIDSVMMSMTIDGHYYRVFYIEFNTHNDAFIRLLNANWLVVKNDGKQVMLHQNDLIPLGISPVTIIDDYIYYVSAQSKLVRLNTLNFDYKLYATAEGFQSSDLTNTKFVKINDKVYFASTHSLLELDIKPPTINKAKVIIGQIKIGDKLIYDVSNALTLPYSQNSFSIKYNVVDLHSHANNKLSYRLLPSESNEWMKLEAYEINFNKLPASKYQLEIKNESYNNFYPASITKLSITVLPPWYNTWWFYLVCIVCLSYLVRAYIKNRIAKIRLRNEIENKLSQSEMKALQSQMNPHFVFNCLNSIKLLVVQNETQRAASYLNKFSSLIRSILDESQKSVIDLQSAIKHLNEYFELEQLRIKDLNYKITVAPSINQAYATLPSMLIQPLAENAIWHGKNIEENKSEVLVKFTETDEYLICEIEDFGVGFDESTNKVANHNSVGLSNITKRILLLNQQYNQNNKIELINKRQSGTGKGTIVRLSFEKNNLI